MHDNHDVHPRNMLLAGIVLVLLNVAALAPMATGAVEGAVEDNFASFSKDSVCANDDCTEAEEDWASSTSSRLLRLLHHQRG